MAENAVMTVPTETPTVTLAGDVTMPMVGFGTWPMKGHQACEAVLTALRAGYRHVDTATMYANEAEVGQIAWAHSVTPAQVVLRWHLEHGIAIIPKSAEPKRIAANLDLFGFSLDPAEVARIDGLAAR
jgi:diketogulonate reductase-like aldo/keto reductase